MDNVIYYPMPETDTADLLLLERLFLALGDKTRLKLLALMADGPVAVGFLVDRLGESQPKVSRHLAYMRQAGIVSTRRDGKWIYYGIRYPEHAAARAILAAVVSSLVAMRVDGQYTYFTQTPDETDAILRRSDVDTPVIDDGMSYPSAENPWDLETDEVEQWDDGEAGGSDQDEQAGEISPNREDEMEVFLL